MKEGGWDTCFPPVSAQDGGAGRGRGPTFHMFSTEQHREVLVNSRQGAGSSQPLGPGGGTASLVPPLAPWKECSARGHRLEGPP